jgi:hypothetical protein
MKRSCTLVLASLVAMLTPAALSLDSGFGLYPSKLTGNAPAALNSDEASAESLSTQSLSGQSLLAQSSKGGIFLSREGLAAALPSLVLSDNPFLNNTYPNGAPLSSAVGSAASVYSANFPIAIAAGRFDPLADPNCKMGPPPAVPEPSTLLLVGSGLLLMTLQSSRIRRKHRLGM